MFTTLRQKKNAWCNRPKQNTWEECTAAMFMNQELANNISSTENRVCSWKISVNKQQSWTSFLSYFKTQSLKRSVFRLSGSCASQLSVCLSVLKFSCLTIPVCQDIKKLLIAFFVVHFYFAHNSWQIHHVLLLTVVCSLLLWRVMRRLHADH